MSFRTIDAIGVAGAAMLTKAAAQALRWRGKHEAAYERSLSGLRNSRLLSKLGALAVTG
jgi:hypothetical protein